MNRFYVKVNGKVDVYYREKHTAVMRAKDLYETSENGTPVQVDDQNGETVFGPFVVGKTKWT